ncbi:DUF4360 domain-containing protein [Streptomyces odontomachi]|uniref:DUF4360 domain-containing protein n=1 Tax=Streptomyces odontomachi TaxID=2944940 RepID=UPI00210C0ADF|nr:DUF4360 domain-containing protein [Streptomyces sp. ODS25]
MPKILAAGGAAVALFAAALSAQGAQAATTPDAAPSEATQVSIESVNGSGCPAGTARVSVASDNSTLTVTYSNYYALAGIGAEPTDARKNCQLILDVEAPAGYTYAIFGLDYSGHAHIEAGATGSQRSEYFFQGSTSGVVKSHTITGPYDGDWSTSDDTSDQLVWAPCDAQRYLNVNTELRVDAGTSDTQHSSSLIAMRSTDAPASTYHLTWKKC